MITGAIFDVDGTLLTSNYAWQAAAVELLDRRGIPENEIGDQFMKRDLSEVLKECRERWALDFSAEEFMDELNSLMEKYYFYEVEPKPGALDFLAYLRKNGVKTSIATATERHLIVPALERTGMREFFPDEMFFTTWEVGHSKFEPIIFDLAREKMGTALDSTAVFEDSYYSMVTAKKAGYTVCAVRDDFENGADERLRAVSDYYHNNLKGYLENEDFTFG